MAKKKISVGWQQKLADDSRKQLLSEIQKVDAKLFSALTDAAKSVEKIITKLPDSGVGALVRRSAYRQYQSSLYTITTQLWAGKISPSIQEGLEQATLRAVESNEQILQFLTKSAPGSSAALMESLRASASRSWMDVRSRLINDIQLSPKVYKNAAYTAGKIDQVVNRGIALGKSAREIAGEVKAFVSPTTPGGVKFASMRLGRSELNNAFHATTTQTYAQQPWIKGVEWNISGSHPHGDECDDLAGDSPYERDSVPDKPHAMCFCFLTAVTVEPEEFLDNLFKGEYDGDPIIDQAYNEAGISTEEIVRARVKGSVPGPSPITFLNRQDADAWSWRKGYKKWKTEELDWSEKESLEHYIGQGFQTINRALRAGRANRDVKPIMSALSKAPKLDEDIFVFRGGSDRLIQNIKPGDVISDKAFLSTSLDPDVARRFISGGHGSLLRIHLPPESPGAYIKGLDEAEFLLAPETKLEILSVNEKKILIPNPYGTYEVEVVDCRVVLPDASSVVQAVQKSTNKLLERTGKALNQADKKALQKSVTKVHDFLSSELEGIDSKWTGKILSDPKKIKTSLTYEDTYAYMNWDGDMWINADWFREGDVFSQTSTWIHEMLHGFSKTDPVAYAPAVANLEEATVEGLMKVLRSKYMSQNKIAWTDEMFAKESLESGYTTLVTHMEKIRNSLGFTDEQSWWMDLFKVSGEDREMHLLDMIDKYGTTPDQRIALRAELREVMNWTGEKVSTNVDIFDLDALVDKAAESVKPIPKKPIPKKTPKKTKKEFETSPNAQLKKAIAEEDYGGVMFNNYIYNYIYDLAPEFTNWIDSRPLNELKAMWAKGPDYPSYIFLKEKGLV